MYGSKEIFLGFIWDLSDVFTVILSPARVQIQFLNSYFIVQCPFWREYFWELVLKKIFNNNSTKNVTKILK